MFACSRGPVPTDLLDGGGELQTQLDDLVLGSGEVTDPRQRCPAKQTEEGNEKGLKKPLKMQRNMCGNVAFAL